MSLCKGIVAGVPLQRRKRPGSDQRNFDSDGKRQIRLREPCLAGRDSVSSQIPDPELLSGLAREQKTSSKVSGEFSTQWNETNLYVQRLNSTSFKNAGAAD